MLPPLTILPEYRIRPNSASSLIVSLKNFSCRSLLLYTTSSKNLTASYNITRLPLDSYQHPPLAYLPSSLTTAMAPNPLRLQHSMVHCSQKRSPRRSACGSPPIGGAEYLAKQARCERQQNDHTYTRARETRRHTYLDWPQSLEIATLHGQLFLGDVFSQKGLRQPAN